MSHLLCFGLGYTAQALARLLVARGWRVAGTSRTDEAVAELRRQRFEAFVFNDQDAADVSKQLEAATHVVVSVAPDAQGDAVLRRFGKELAAAPNLKWIGYLSTVGVYGNTLGGWVDEGSEVSGDFDRTRWRIAAEQAWLQLATAAPSARVEVFRLAGIYGPQRSAFDSLRSGRAQRIVKPGQVFNRIHVDDIAAVLAAAMTGHGAHTIYNVTDDEPAPPQDVITFAAELLGVDPPPEIDFAEAALSPMARSFYEANRRVSNARVKGDLGVRLLYPNYRDGLRAILADERSS